MTDVDDLEVQLADLREAVASLNRLVYDLRRERVYSDARLARLEGGRNHSP